LRKSLAACDELGIDAEWVDRVEPFAVPGLRFAQQARFRPHQYPRALAGELDGHDRGVVALRGAGTLAV